MEKIHEFTLDISKGTNTTNITTVTGDYASHKFLITLVEDGYKPVNLEDTIVRLVVRKSDGTTVQQDCTIVDAEGIVSVLLKLDTINVAGTCKAEIQIWDNEVANKRLTSAQFYFRVRKSLQDDETVESTDQFSMLQSALEQAQNIDEKIQNKADLDENGKVPLSQLPDNIGGDEELRQEVEEARGGHTSLNDRFVELETEVKEASSITIGPTTDSVIPIPSNAKGQISVGIQGRTITNLLGSDGDFENGISGFSAGTGNISATIDTANKVFGNQSLKLTSTVAEVLYKYKSYNVETNKYYFLSGYTKSDGQAKSAIHANVGSGIDVLSPSLDTSWRRGGAKFQPTNTTLNLYLYARDGIGSCWYDGLMLVEISADEYSTLTNEQLLAKYNFITGTKSTLSQRVVSCGKNLFDINAPLLHREGKNIGVAKQNNGLIVTEATQDIGGIVCKVKPNTQYTVSYKNDTDEYIADTIRVVFYDSYPMYSYTPDRVDDYVKQTSFTTPSDCNYVVVGLYAMTVGNMMYDIQLEEGSTATAYEPYKGVKSYILLPDGMELRSVGDIQDEFKDGKLYKRTGEYVLKSTDITNFNTSGTNVITVQFSLSLLTGCKPQQNHTTDGTININGFREIPASLDAHIGYDFVTTTDTVVISFPKNLYSSLSEVQNALAGTTVIYQLAQEEVYDLNMTPLQIFEGGSVYLEPVKVVDGEIIDADPSESTIPDISMKVPANQGARIDSLDNAIAQQSRILNEHELALLTLSLQALN